jgi:hypothetical protein
MLRWHNPANLDATALVADAIAAYAGEGGEPDDRPWAYKRSLAAGLLLAERTRGGLGVTGELDADALAAAIEGDGVDRDGFRTGVRAVAAGPVDAARAARLARDAGLHAAELPLLWRDLGEAYGVPLPLWFWSAGPEFA